VSGIAPAIQGLTEYAILQATQIFQALNLIFLQLEKVPPLAAVWLQNQHTQLGI
jgi:hypothetical protein